MARKVKQDSLLWKGITEEDFLNEEDNISDEDISEYNTNQMITFIQGVNLMRHFPRVADSLKPVERRILYTLFLGKAFPGTKPKKSAVPVGQTMELHPHGDSSIYGTSIGMSQPFKNPVPMIHIPNNNGNDTNPDGYAHQRYTDMTMSKYSQECFFSDFDWDCIETIFNTTKDGDEPLVLPCKFPNILVNGGFGIATGHSFCIPCFHIPDIVRLTKKLLRNPVYEDIYIRPNSPTGCDIVDNGTLREICDTGNGTLKMRATITVEENPRKPNVWILRVHNLPWMTGMDAVSEKLRKLTKEGILPIKDIEDHSFAIKVKNPNGGMFTRKQIQYDIIINKAHDPQQIIDKLYKRTPLEKSISVNFKIVTDMMEIDMLNMRDLILTWIDIRREYLRRLVNKKIAKLTAQVDFLEIMVYLTSKDNLMKTMKIIRSTSSSYAVKALMKIPDIKINSYQAEKIVESKLKAFSKESHAKYKKELQETKEELHRYKNMTKSTKIIDEIIEEQQDDLLKYLPEWPKSQIVSEETNRKIADTDHFLVITKLGMIKKLPYNLENMMRRKSPVLGVFKNQDYPTHDIILNNHDSLMAFDNFGMYSCVPVHEIDNTEPSQYGTRVYDCLKLNGEIVHAFHFVSKDLESFIKKTVGNVFVVTLTKNGYLKKTPISEFTDRRNQKNVRAMKIREGDELVFGMIMIEQKKKGSNLMIYTEKGRFAHIHSDNIPLQSKDASGLLSIKLDDDACRGMCVIGNHDTHLLVVTEKGNVKRCELEYLGQPGKRKISSYLTVFDKENVNNDKVFFVDAVPETFVATVCTRTSYEQIKSSDIPIKTRKSKCVKMIKMPLGTNLISVKVREEKES